MHVRVPILAGLCATALALGAHAVDLEAGTEINAANLDQNLDARFDGHRLQDLIPPRLASLIREHGLRLWLKPAAPHVLDPEYIEWNRRNLQTVHYDPATREVHGWQAGIPFPQVDLADPHCGDKIAWNLFLGAAVGTDLWLPNWNYLLIDLDGGLEREQQWSFFRYYAQGRWASTPSAAPDPDLFYKQLIYARSPFDIKGLGLYVERHRDGRLDNTWAYVRAFRRVRRLSGGAWMDPIGGTDVLLDEYEGFSAHPLWYPRYRCVERRWVLASRHARPDRIRADAQTSALRYPTLDLARAPYWNAITDWEPTEVLMLEALPAPEHPYSRKLMAVSEPVARVMHAEAYDRAGEFWKFMNFILATIEPATSASSWAGARANDGHRAVMTMQLHVVDFKRRHATVFIADETALARTGLTSADVSLQRLEHASAR